MPEPMSYGRQLGLLAAEKPDRDVIVQASADGGERVVSRRELDRRANQVARLLADRSVGQGDLVVIALPNSAEHFFATYGAFASCRAADQIRVTVAYTNLNVKIGGAHGGISVGPDGATHQAMEEISIIRSIPNMSIIVPADYWETYKATLAAARHPGPVYLRFGREDVPVVTAEDTPFTFGRGEVFAEGRDLTIIACGVMVYEALRARETLAGRGIAARVVDLHTIKPIDAALIERCARETGVIVTAEEHQVNGGLGGAVAEVVVRSHPVPMEFVAVMDRFGQSGKPAELMDAFGLRARDIVAAAERALARKPGR